MKIGIITSWLENIILTRLCQSYSVPYTILLDSALRPHDDKELSVVIKSITNLIQQWKHNGCTHFLVSPIIELYCLHHSVILWIATDIIPLFSSYLKYNLTHSLVGKIWLLGTQLDISQIEILWKSFVWSYQLSTPQSATKNFNTKFPIWCKKVPMRNYFLSESGFTEF